MRDTMNATNDTYNDEIKKQTRGQGVNIIREPFANVQSMKGEFNGLFGLEKDQQQVIVENN